MRHVGTVPAHADAILAEIEGLSFDCARGVDFLLEELEEQDPDVGERCGLLGGRYELYVMRIPDCPRHAMIVSLDTARQRPWPCILHGLIPRKVRPRDAARLIASAQFKLVRPSWEPAP